MTNTQYIDKILSSVERILVDTSTLMTNGFQQFICNNKDRLLADGKEIIVPKAVYTELARHMESTDSEKSELAMAAIELMALNKNVFQIENTTLTEEDIAHAFADAQLLSELTLHRSDYNQLLITNDRKLSCDAFDLNQQQSSNSTHLTNEPNVFEDIWKFDWLSGLISLSGIGLVYGLYKSGKILLRNIR